MSQSSEQSTPRYVTCQCQHCDGHIEFDANEFVEESSIVPCPHCGLETKIFIPILQAEEIPAELPTSISSPNAVRREGFFYEEVAIQETGTNVSGEPIPTQNAATLPTDRQTKSSISNDEHSQPPLSKKAISGRDSLRELMYLRNFLQEQNETSGFKSKTVMLFEQVKLSFPCFICVSSVTKKFFARLKNLPCAFKCGIV
jgi:hypothetical protein